MVDIGSHFWRGYEQAARRKGCRYDSACICQTALKTLAGREHDIDTQELHILCFVVDAQSRHVGVQHKRVILLLWVGQ